MNGILNQYSMTDQAFGEGMFKKSIEQPVSEACNELSLDNSVSEVMNRDLSAMHYEGVREASKYLQSQMVPRQYRKQILQSFEIETISLQVADGATFGLRFYGGAARPLGRYLFPTFTDYINRIGLALKPDWNSMAGIAQFQVAQGSTYILGRASSQGGVYIGGSKQMYINNLKDLIRLE